jgi:TRAP-type C4-dicarboxylate transport system permease small subunit
VNRLKPALATAMQGVARAAWALACGLTGLMLAVLSWQVFMRSALNAPPSWTEEVALLAFGWAVLLAVACGVREGLHVRMDILLDVLPAPLRRACERAVLAAVVFTGGYLGVAGWRYTLESQGSTSPAIGYPMPLLYAGTVVCGVLVALFGLERLVAGPAGAADEADGQALPEVAAVTAAGAQQGAPGDAPRGAVRNTAAWP